MVHGMTGYICADSLVFSLISALETARVAQPAAAARRRAPKRTSKGGGEDLGRRRRIRCVETQRKLGRV